MRRAFAIVATLLMLTCLCACGGGRGLTPAAQNAAAPPPRLDLAGWAMPELPATVPPAPDDPVGLRQAPRAVTYHEQYRT